MPELTPSIVQGALLLLAALPLRRRVAIAALALATVATGLALGVPHDPLGRPPGDVALELAPVAAALALALVVATLRAGRDDGAPRARPPAERRGGRDTLVAALATTLLVAGTAIGLYVEGRTVPGWRGAVDGWLASPALRSIGPPSAASASAGATADASTSGRAAAARAPRDAGAGAGGGAGAGATAGATAGAAGGTGAGAVVVAGAGAGAGAGTAPRPAARPRGDLRDCLAQGSNADVVRCAERAR
ncbi:MAG TPA: hypothetical protein VEA81_14565 [Burkholderiaceae bacterium]|nr:hypothetical protein [Burkholderiaceae bacterium]